MKLVLCEINVFYLKSALILILKRSRDCLLYTKKNRNCERTRDLILTHRTSTRDLLLRSITGTDVLFLKLNENVMKYICNTDDGRRGAVIRVMG